MKTVSRNNRKPGRPPTGQTRVKLGIAITEGQFKKLMHYCRIKNVGTSRAIQALLDALPEVKAGQR